MDSLKCSVCGEHTTTFYVLAVAETRKRAKVPGFPAECCFRCAGAANVKLPRYLLSTLIDVRDKKQFIHVPPGWLDSI